MLEFFIANSATIGTIFFFLTFCYIIYFTFKKSNKKRFEEDAKIPMNDEEKK